MVPGDELHTKPNAWGRTPFRKRPYVHGIGVSRLSANVCFQNPLSKSRSKATIVWKRLQPAPVNIGRRRSETSRITRYAPEATPVAPVTRKPEGWSSTAQEFCQSRDSHHENCQLQLRVTAS